MKKGPLDGPLSSPSPLIALNNRIISRPAEYALNIAPVQRRHQVVVSDYTRWSDII